VRRGVVVALVTTVTVCVLALGVHWTVSVRAQSAPAPAQGAPSIAQSAPIVVQSAPSIAQSAPSIAQSAPIKDEIGDEVQTVPRGKLPVFAGEGDTAALYRFATTRGDVLRWMPCTCGCAQFGHTSNRSCYIKKETDAEVTYTSHAAT